MNELSRWMPTIITLVSAALVVGSYRKQTQVNTENITTLQAEQDDQWSHINRTRERVGFIEGQMSINHRNDADLPPAGPHRRTKGASA